ncbi:C6 transcription factor [Aspergillus luchuensis]|uniref:C6 transcription factor n=1 Tax=Aspergillus kawachii TaxID=1069201 RepID=A0A146F6X4_ASPKA|nr:C6 transcription factor [Aspergillus luchuensis]
MATKKQRICVKSSLRGLLRIKRLDGGIDRNPPSQEELEAPHEYGSLDGKGVLTEPLE